MRSSKWLVFIHSRLAGFDRSLTQFRLRKVGFDPFQKQIITQTFDVDRNELPRTKSLLEMVEFDMHCAVCNSQQLTCQQSG